MIASDQHRLLARVARLYYEQDLTQLQIGSRLRLSRQKVQRMLKHAKASGVVRISIAPVVGAYAELEEKLEERYGLREAVVVEAAPASADDQSAVSRQVGAAAAGYLLRVLQADDRVVISWGGTIAGMVDALAYRSASNVEGVTVIQGLGGLGDPVHESHASDLTRRMARALDATAVLLPAPGVAGSREARKALYNDSQVRQALDRAKSATIAVMGIGVPRRDSILVREGTIVSWNELRDLQSSAGAVGDINLRYFDAQGHPVKSAIDDRVIGLGLAELRSIPHVVGVAGGAGKVEAIRAALTGKLLNVLVTDHATAARLTA